MKLWNWKERQLNGAKPGCEEGSSIYPRMPLKQHRLVRDAQDVAIGSNFSIASGGTCSSLAQPKMRNLTWQKMRGGDRAASYLVPAAAKVHRKGFRPGRARLL